MQFVAGLPQETRTRPVMFIGGFGTFIGNPLTTFIEHLLCALLNSSLTFPLYLRRSLECG